MNISGLQMNPGKSAEVKASEKKTSQLLGDKKIEKEIKDSQAAEAKHAEADKEVSREEAQKVAEKLQLDSPSTNFRFMVKDPTSSSVDNVVIQVLDNNNHVIATIPKDVVTDMAKNGMTTGDGLKGLSVNQVVK